MVPRATDRDPAPLGVPLAVRLVTVDGRTLRGVLARYDDPEWELPLETAFVGTLGPNGRTIGGSFRAEGTTVDTIPQEGRWWARRAPEAVALQTDPPRRFPDDPQP
jgi:hypothetical protein